MEMKLRSRSWKTWVKRETKTNKHWNNVLHEIQLNCDESAFDGSKKRRREANKSKQKLKVLIVTCGNSSKANPMKEMQRELQKPMKIEQNLFI